MFACSTLCFDADRISCTTLDGASGGVDWIIESHRAITNVVSDAHRRNHIMKQ